MIALHGENVSQTLNIRLRVLTVSGLGTTGMHQASFLQESNLGGTNPGEFQVELAQNLTNGSALHLARVAVRGTALRAI